MTESWLYGLAGGAILGVSGLIMLLGLGRITGISGIFNQAITTKEGRGWRLCFLLGIVGGVGVFQSLSEPMRLAPYQPEFSLSGIWYVIAGLLVGLGSGLGSGCTSGHGICGMSRLSERSIYAVTVFMLVAVITASLFYSVLWGASR